LARFTQSDIGVATAILGLALFVFGITAITWAGTNMPYGTYAYFLGQRLEMTVGAVLMAVGLWIRSRSSN
jgi:hypothetical protein